MPPWLAQQRNPAMSPHTKGKEQAPITLTKASVEKKPNRPRGRAGGEENGRQNPARRENWTRQGITWSMQPATEHACTKDRWPRHPISISILTQKRQLKHKISYFYCMADKILNMPLCCIYKVSGISPSCYTIFHSICKGMTKMEWSCYVWWRYTHHKQTTRIRFLEVLALFQK